MDFFPKIKRCPCCQRINLVKVNGINYDNNFQSLKNWTLKKLFNCSKCKSELGFFLDNDNINSEKLVWIDLLKCEDNYHNDLNQLQKFKNNSKKFNKKYFETVKKITDIQNKIRIEQAKVKIKYKIETKNSLVRF